VRVASDTQGLSLPEVRDVVARDLGTRPASIEVADDGPDARELAVTDGGGHHLGTVRVVRAPEKGWVVATTNTCGD
jgi:hypothetical protein